MSQWRHTRWLWVACAVVIAIGLSPWLAPHSPQVDSDAVRRLTRTAPPTLEKEFSLALEALRRGDSHTAISGFRHFLARAPRQPEAHVNLGFALLSVQAYDEARAAFMRAIDLRRSQANAYYGLAVSEEGRGDLAGALGAMRAFVHLAPPNQAHLRRARAAIWEWQARLERTDDRAHASTVAGGVSP